MASVEEVRAAAAASLRLLWMPDAVYELRVPKTRRGTASGYFDNPEALAGAGAKLDGQAPGIFMTMNPVKPALLARAHNRIRDERSPKTTSDPDIVNRAWWFLDFDPDRPSDTSSTDEQHAAALARAGDCARWLLEEGFSRESIIGADSGNGAHLLIRIDLPNDEEAATLVKRATLAVALRFSDETITVDTSTGAASHLMKVYGTTACKGDNLPDYPHRSSCIVRCPERPVPAARELLQKVASYAPAPVAQNTRADASSFDLEGFVARHLGENAMPPKPWNGGRIWSLRECVFKPSHTGGTASLIQMASGAIVYRCHHASCQGRGWSEVRAQFEPRRPRPFPDGSHPNGRADAAPVKDEPPRLATVSMIDVQPEETEWLWEPRIPQGKFVLLEGDPGLGKSVLTCVLAAALSRGWPLPGQDRSAIRGAQRVLLLPDEDGLGDTVRPRLQALDANLSLIRAVTGLLRRDEESPLMLDADGVRALTEEVEDFRPALVIIDPLSSYLGGKVDTNKGNEVRAILRPLVALCQRSGTTVLGLRHFTKANGTAAIYRGQGNIEFLATARSVLAVQEDPDNVGRVILCHTKSNLAPKAPGLAFRIGTGHGGVQFFWEGQVDISTDELFAQHDEDRSAMDEAKAFLQDILFDGPRGGKEVQHAAREAGVTERTLWRAKSRLGVKARKEKESGVWTWILPPMPDRPDSNPDSVEPGQDVASADFHEADGAVRPWWNRDDQEPF